MDRLSTDEGVAPAHPLDDAPVRGGVHPVEQSASADPEMTARQWALIEALAQGLVDTYGPEYRL